MLQSSSKNLLLSFLMYDILILGDSMSNRKIKKGTTRRLMTFGIFSLILFGYFLFTMISYAVSIINLKAKEKELSNELISLKEQEKGLKNEIIKLNDPEYIAKYARSEYHYSKDGEYIIQMNKKDEVKEVSKNNDLKNNSIIILSGISLLAIVVLVRKMF